MDPWLLSLCLGFLTCAALLAALALVGKVRVTFRLVAKAEPSGAWALVLGGECFRVAVTFVAAEGVPAHLLFFFLGRKVWQITIAELRAAYGRRKERPKKKKKRKKGPQTSTTEELRALYRSIEPWVEPADGAAFLLGEHRRVRLDWLTIAAGYGAEDPTITGQITGLLYVLDTWLPRRVHLVPEPDWTPRNRLSLTVDGCIALSPGLFLKDVVSFAARALVHRARHRAPAVALANASTPPPLAPTTDQRARLS